MKVYLIFSEWTNDGVYEYFQHGSEFYGICDNFDKAVLEIEKHIPEKNQEDDIYELEWLYKNVNKGSIKLYHVAKLIHGDGSDLDTYDENFYIREEEIK